MEPTIIHSAGGGFTDLGAIRIDKKVREYDQFLRFGYNPANQDYILYVIMPRDFDSYYIIDGDPAYPILGFGKELPSEDSVLARLRAADVRKRGLDIYNQLLKYNAELKSRDDLKTSAQVEEAAYRIEHFTRKAGMTEKYGKVAMHVPKTKGR